MFFGVVHSDFEYGIGPGIGAFPPLVANSTSLVLIKAEL
jgi:hypothetical protein